VNIVLIIGSSPDALRAKEWPKAPFRSLVAINNAWNIRADWDYLVYPDDFARERRPATIEIPQCVVEHTEYVPAQNVYGGVVYIGGTMAFTTAYWALHALKPDVLAFVGCDMVYPKNSRTHFYGRGSADPLRDDITLQSLEAKSIRLQAHALKQQCYCVNLSALGESRLAYPVLSDTQFFSDKRAELIARLANKIDKHYSVDKMDRAKAQEEVLNYNVDSGDYWHYLDQLDTNKLYELDQQWLSVLGQVSLR